MYYILYMKNIILLTIKVPALIIYIIAILFIAIVEDGIAAIRGK